LRELWRHVQANGGLGSLRAPSFRIPRSIGDTIDLRLRAMSPATVRSLELAAVIGDPGDPATLVAASDVDLGTTLAAIDAGVGSAILRIVAPDPLSYAFAHDLARQALLERIPPARRAELHARVARSLEASLVPTARRSSRLAHHWSQAGPYDTEGRSVHWLTRAGQDAERSLAFEEAAAHFEQAAARVPTDDARRPELVLSAAANAVLSGSFADGRRLYETLATSSDDPEIVARAAIGYEDSCWRPGLLGDRAVELLGGAAQALPTDHPLRIPVLASLGRALGFIGRHDQASAVGDHAIALARRRGDDKVLAAALQASLWNKVGAPDVTELAAARACEGGQLAERLGDWELVGQAATYRGSLAYQAGRPEEWRQAHHQLEQVQHRSGQPFYAYMARCSDHASAYLSGDFATARRITDELLELGAAFGQDDTEGIYGLQSFMVRRATGDLDAVRRFVTGDEAPNQSYWAPGLLALYTEFGLSGPARRVADQILRSDLDAERLTSQWAAIVVFLAEAVCELRDDTAARRLLPYLEPHAGMNLIAGHFVAVFGSADRYLAMLYDVLGEAVDADDHFRRALDMDGSMGASVHRAETLARYAAFLHRHDPARAAAVRAEAHELAHGLGMARLAQRTAPPAPTADPGPATFPDGLTKREVEVLACLARGLSNRELAAALFIAENTAANHVRSIMVKTGSSNRTQAAMYATARSLV
jgi:DNA-binding CsgD family transcriptional regulator/tetratricopeptide (TPR) repeat protein